MLCDRRILIAAFVSKLVFEGKYNVFEQLHKWLAHVTKAYRLLPYGWGRIVQVQVSQRQGVCYSTSKYYDK